MYLHREYMYRRSCLVYLCREHMYRRSCPMYLCLGYMYQCHLKGIGAGHSPAFLAAQCWRGFQEAFSRLAGI